MADVIPAVDETGAPAEVPARPDDEPWFDEEPKPEVAEGEEAAADAKPPEPAPKPGKKAAKEPPKPVPDEKSIAQSYAILRKREREIERTARDAQQLLENAKRLDEERQADERLKRDDPYKWAQRHGLNFRELVERVAKEGDEDPRDVKIRMLEQRLEEIDGTVKQRLEAEKKAEEARQYDQTVADEIAYVKGEIEGGAESYPALMAAGVEETSGVAHARWYYYDKQGQTKDIEDVLAELEVEYQQLADKLAPLRKEKPAESQSKRLGSPSRGNGAARSAKPGTQTASPSLTERAISQRAAGDRQLTDDEEMELLASRIAIER